MQTIFKRREFLKKSALGAAAVSLSGFNCLTRKSSPKPNIILILADDLGYGDLGCYGQRKFTTPNIDTLAAAGIRFSDFYAGSTVCAPSRSCLLTGLHSGHTPIRGNKEIQPLGQTPLPANELTVAEVLKQAGYVTGAFGKWGLGYPGSEGDPNRQGFDEFFGYNCQRRAHNYYPRHLWFNSTQLTLAENEGQKQGIFAPDLIHQKSLQFIEQNKDHPFFLFIPSIIPHAELIAPEEYMRRYRGKYLPEKVYRGYDDGPKYRLGPYGSQNESHAAFAAMINILDDQVGEIVAKIKSLDLDNDTLILFSSDNGPHLEGGADPDFFNSNGPFRGYKRDLFEGGIRVPMIASWPGVIKAGSVSNHISAFWDFLPIFCDIADVASTRHIDGISFLPTLTGETDSQYRHKYLYWEFHEQGGKQAVRRGEWKAIRLGVRSDPEGPLALYNLKDDPGENHNVADTYPAIVQELGDLIVESHTETSLFPFI